MASRFERYVAMRYLRAARGRTASRRFLKFVTYVAVGGVAVGVAALLLALAIVRGFSSAIQEKIVGFGAHVQVENFRNVPIDDATAIRQELEGMAGVREVAPVVLELALMRRSATDIDGVSVWGTRRLPPYLTSHVVEGTGTFDADTTGRPGLVLGKALSRELHVAVGDRLTAFSMRNLGESTAQGAFRRPRVKQFHVSGIYETSLTEFDELYAFTGIEAARDLFEYGDEQVTRFDVTLADVDSAGAVAIRMEDRLGFPIIARSIFEVYRSLFAWVNLQEGIIPLVIGGIILVGAFNIVGALLMIILEKNREIGILESMGASARTLRKLFLWLGAFIGVAGTAIGEVVALALAWIQLHYAIIPLPAEAYYMKTAPIELNPFDFVIVGVLALALCLLAAYVPARVASRVEPIRAIHFR